MSLAEIPNSNSNDKLYEFVSEISSKKSVLFSQHHDLHNNGSNLIIVNDIFRRSTQQLRFRSLDRVDKSNNKPRFFYVDEIKKNSGRKELFKLEPHF
jgi:hypothetical protein